MRTEEIFKELERMNEGLDSLLDAQLDLHNGVV